MNKAALFPVVFYFRDALNLRNYHEFRVERCFPIADGHGYVCREVTALDRHNHRTVLARFLDVCQADTFRQMAEICARA